MPEAIIKTLPPKIQPEPLDETNPQDWQGHIILCGVNNLGFRILEQLLALKVRVVMIDDSPEQRLAQLVARKQVILMPEDSRLPETLVRAGIRQASALITVANDDLHNLETVLAANEETPGIRTVASFFNQQIGKQLVSTVKNARSVSLAERAGPAFVSAALPGRLQDVFKLNNSKDSESLAVAEVEVKKAGSLQELYGPLTIIALRKFTVPATDPNPTYSLLLCPPPTTSVKPGDRVTLLGRVEKLQELETVQLTSEEIQEARQALEAASGKPVVMRKQRRSRVGRFRRVLGRMIRQTNRPFRYAGLALLVVIALSTFVFKYFYSYYDPVSSKQIELDWVSAVYFTVTIITTTGFGDFNLAIQEWPLKIFGIFSMLSGAATVACLFAFLTNYLISIRLDEELGRQQATEMENHVIMCGLGTVGLQTLKGLLQRGQQVVVIEQQIGGRFNSEAKGLGVPIIEADARSPETLRQANIDKATCIVVMTSDDMANLETALVARSLKPDLRVVLRLFDRNLAEKVQRTFNINIARSASAMAAPAFIAEAFDYQQLSSFYVDLIPFTVAQETVESNSRLSGLTVGELQVQAGVQVLAHLRRPNQSILSAGLSQNGESQTILFDIEPTFHPSANLLINQSDVITYVGSYDRIISAHQLNTVRQD